MTLLSYTAKQHDVTITYMTTKSENENPELIEFIGDKFERMDEHFERVDEHFERVDKRFEEVDERLDGLQNEVREKYDKILNGQDTISGKLNQIITEQQANTQSYKHHDEKLEDHEGRLEKLETKTGITSST